MALRNRFFIPFAIITPCFDILPSDTPFVRASLLFHGVSHFERPALYRIAYCI